MPDVHSSNPVIGKLLYWIFDCLPTVKCIEKTKIKKKRPGMAHLKKVQGEWVEVNRLLATPEVRGSNPVIGKLLYGTFVDCQLY